MLNDRGSRPLAGAVLAGGRSSRMGRDKALLSLGGLPLLRLLLERLRRHADPVVIIAADNGHYGDFGVPVLGDLHPGCGPLGGIHTALRSLEAQETFILPCDTPFVSAELIAYIAGFPSDAPARVARMDDRLHPLCGVYSPACLPAIEDALAAGRLALRELLAAVGATTVPVTPDLPFYHGRLLANLNDPATLSALDSA